MLTSDLDFRLPSGLVATGPLPLRGKGARLLVLHRDSGKIEHRAFADVLEYLRGLPVYVNDARLYRGQLTAWEPNGHAFRVELIHRRSELEWEALVKADERLVAGRDLTLSDGSLLSVGPRVGSRYVVRFQAAPDLEALGLPSISPWCRRPGSKGEHAWYEPVYAKATGTASGPGAGIHFTAAMLEGLDVRTVTLQPDGRAIYQVSTPAVEGHASLLPPESYRIPDPPAGPVACIGTTVVKALETYARTGKAEGESDLFIYDPFEFKRTRMLLTCFAFPRETPLALQMAFAGREKLMTAYRSAVDEKYRWNIYGDSLLIV